jgi:hypothetical protein
MDVNGCVWMSSEKKTKDQKDPGLCFDKGLGHDDWFQVSRPASFSPGKWENEKKAGRHTGVTGDVTVQAKHHESGPSTAAPSVRKAGRLWPGWLCSEDQPYDDVVDQSRNTSGFEDSSEYEIRQPI